LDNISLNEACKILSISTATGRNWLKSGRLTSPLSKHAVTELLINIQSNNIDKLKSRRNKNHISGVFAPKGYTNDNSYKTVCNIISKAINGYEKVILAEYSLKLLRSVGLIKSEHSILLEEYFVKNPLIDDLLGNNSINDEIKPALIFDVEFTAGQDFLGLLYMSLQTLTSRKSNGVYYTPISVVEDTIKNLQIDKPSATIVDPCCGTGNFLINAFIHKNIMIENIYGQDIDSISIMLTRINMLLVSKTDNIEVLYKNFRCEDSLFSNNNNKYDVIIGNPPWGANLNQPKKARNIESFCIFIERAINICSDNGIICFILPEAILNVKTHNLIREYIALKCRIKMIKYWGNVFSGVYTPAITLTLLKNYNFTTTGIIIRNEKTTFEINTNRKFGNFNFNLTDNQYKIMQKIESLKDVAYLKNNADFALGIVTGDNSKFIKNEKTENSEIILKGSDIYKYSFKKANNYIEFTPNLFQQVSKTKFYRTKEKLLYRFICESLVFAYDNSQTLSLNSANILIPKIDELHIKYILAVLNSRAVQFYFSLKYNSIKILRSHIESIPIPVVDIATQQKIIDKVNTITPDIYEEIDKIIMDLYNLNKLEIDEIETTIQNYNLFI